MKKHTSLTNQLIDMPIFPSFRLVRPLIGDKRVLDVGCGVGRYLENFSEDSTGIEYSIPGIKECRKKNLKIIADNVDKGFPVKNHQFEVVFASHIIEHVKSPFEFLEEANRVLKTQGLIVLGYPVEKSLARVFGDHYFNNHNLHLYSFSIDGIRRLLARTGFREERIFVDINLVGRFPILTPILYFANKLPLNLTLWWANALWIIAKKQ